MSLIYEPQGRAAEYCKLACNVYSGCSGGCSYCWVPKMPYAKPYHEFVKPSVRPHFLGMLEREAAAKERRGEAGGQVLLSFTCDPYQPLELERKQTLGAINVLHAHGYKVCVLTKGGSRSLRDIGLFGEGDAYAATLTLTHDAASREWEPGAALPADRMFALKTFHDRGIYTWVSLEPVLDPEATKNIVKTTYPYVDEYRVGKLNYHPRANTIDWRKFANEIVELFGKLNCKYYIKQDLRKYTEMEQ